MNKLVKKAIVLKTVKKAEFVLNWLEQNGYRWASGRPIYNNSDWLCPSRVVIDRIKDGERMVIYLEDESRCSYGSNEYYSLENSAYQQIKLKKKTTVEIVEVSK